jgi:endonuclease/exonuclease/phosphatase family metal-dependent hydrolase
VDPADHRLDAQAVVSDKPLGGGTCLRETAAVRRSFPVGVLVGVLAALALDCGGLGSACIDGREDCSCTVMGTCEPGLFCDDTHCVKPGGDSEATSVGDTTGASATVTMSSTDDDDPTTADGSSESGPVIPCEGSDLRVVTYNVKAVGAQGSDEWNALGSILARLSPDIVCIEELGDFETAPLRALAESLGWGEPIQADPSPAIGGELRNACMGPRPMNRIASYTASDLSPDGSANDLSRDLLAVRVDLDNGCHANLLAMHAKSGQEDLDRFRRQVEFVRVQQAVAAVRAAHPDEGVILMGDFNEQTDDPMIGQVFAAPPPGLPRSYQLGSDIEFPLTYDPFPTVAASGMTRIEVTAEDSERNSTWGVSDGFDGERIDYIWLDGINLDAAIVYDACLDDGVDAPPAGAWIPLTGEPVPCFASQTASDHLPIAADLHVP